MGQLYDVMNSKLSVCILCVLITASNPLMDLLSGGIREGTLLLLIAQRRRILKMQKHKHLEKRKVPSKFGASPGLVFGSQLWV